MVRAFERVPSIVELVRDTGLATRGDDGVTAAACELTLEALVARKKLSRSASGHYTRAQPPERRRPNQDLFGGGMMT